MCTFLREKLPPLQSCNIVSLCKCLLLSNWDSTLFQTKLSQQLIFFGRYIGYSDGNISVLKLDEEPFHIVQMKYTIPLSASHGEIRFSPIFVLICLSIFF